MAILSFPTSPTLNQTYTFGTKTWIWTGLAWKLQTQGAINNVPIGNAIASTGAFTTVTAASFTGGVVSITGNVTGSNVQGGGVILTGNTIGGPDQLTITTANTVISGNLYVQGNTTFVSANNVTTNSLLLQLANNVTLPTLANGAGITVGATGNTITSMLYNSVSNTWNFATGLSVNGNVISSNFATAGRVSATGNVTGNNVVAVAGFLGNNISVSGNVTLGNRLDWTSNGNSAVYQVYNASTGSLDTIFG